MARYGIKFEFWHIDFYRGKKLYNLEENSCSKEENQETTLLTCDTKSGNLTWATVERGEYSHCNATNVMLPSKHIYSSSYDEIESGIWLAESSLANAVEFHSYYRNIFLVKKFKIFPNSNLPCPYSTFLGKQLSCQILQSFFFFSVNRK
jgi:hypothetical protein